MHKFVIVYDDQFVGVDDIGPMSSGYYMLLDSSYSKNMRFYDTAEKAEQVLLDIQNHGGLYPFTANPEKLQVKKISYILYPPYGEVTEF